MKLVEAGTTADGYLTMKQLIAYSTMSDRWLRDAMSQALDPLPSYRAGRKVLVKRSEFDAWMQRRRTQGVAESQDDVVRELLGRLAS
jgi:hypothetical protein